MIVFGTSKNISINNKTIRFFEEGKIKIFNLSSLSENGEKLFSLVPFLPNHLFEPEQEKEFDLAYASYIMENDDAFLDLMKIIYLEYEYSFDTFLIYIMIDFDDVRNTITESLIKYIQQRYGINCNIINDEDDWETVTAGDGFTVTGLYNLDQDKERYSILKEASTNISREFVED